MNVPRRRALHVGLALAAGSAGCIGGFDASDPDDATTTGPTTDGAGRERATPTGDAITVNATVEREHVEYLESEDAIRYVAAWRAPDNVTRSDESPPTRTPVYETVPFAEWAETECAAAAAKRMGGVLESRLNGSVEGVSAGITRVNDTVVVAVTRRTLYDRDGNVISTPTVGFDRLAAVTPRQVTVTLTIENRTTTCTVPVVVQSMEVQQA